MYGHRGVAQENSMPIYVIAFFDALFIKDIKLLNMASWPRTRCFYHAFLKCLS